MLPPKQITILQSLAQYKFLTRAQMARLGVDKYNPIFSKHCKLLLNAKYIGKTDARSYGIGIIYYLTNKGALFIARETNLIMEHIHFCSTKPKVSPQSLHHRKGAIDCQIELYTTCVQNNAQVLFYHRDIDILSRNSHQKSLERKTRIPLSDGKHLEPDAIFMLDTPKGRKLYCLEYEHADYTKKSFQKALLHIEALNLKSPSKKYDHPKAHRTLFIYYNQATMHAVVERLARTVSNINSWLLFKTYDEVVNTVTSKNSKFEFTLENEFFEHWRQANGVKTSAF